MIRPDQLDRQLRKEEDRLSDLYNNGEISREEYNAEMRAIAREERECYEEAREQALREIDSEWGRW